MGDRWRMVYKLRMAYRCSWGWAEGLEQESLMQNGPHQSVPNRVLEFAND